MSPGNSAGLADELEQLPCAPPVVQFVVVPVHQGPQAISGVTINHRAAWCFAGYFPRLWITASASGGCGAPAIDQAGRISLSSLALNCDILDPPMANDVPAESADHSWLWDGRRWPQSNELMSLSTTGSPGSRPTTTPRPASGGRQRPWSLTVDVEPGPLRYHHTRSWDDTRSWPRSAVSCGIRADTATTGPRRIAREDWPGTRSSTSCRASEDHWKALPI